MPCLYGFAGQSFDLLDICVINDDAATRQCTSHYPSQVVSDSTFVMPTVDVNDIELSSCFLIKLRELTF
jgi:hypothetical protein